MTPLLRASTEAQLERFGRRIVAALFGFAFIVAAAGWLYRDVAPDGHVEKSTAIGVGLFLLAGGFLIDRELLTQFLAWLTDQARGVIDVARDWLAKPPTTPTGGAA